MKLVAIILIAGCWTSSPKPAPVENKAPPVAAKPDRGEGKLIQRTQSGGVIELAGDRAAAMTNAANAMEAHCGPNNYTITQEGEEAVGHDTLVGGGGGHTNIVTAWRVHYVCNGPSAP